jgi:hypothetical protein
MLDQAQDSVGRQSQSRRIRQFQGIAVKPALIIENYVPRPPGRATCLKGTRASQAARISRAPAAGSTS